MRILQLALTAAIITAALCNESWSWGKDENEEAKISEEISIQKRYDNDITTTEAQGDLKANDDQEKILKQTQGKFLYSKDEIFSNNTEIEDIVDSILHETREGRALDGYDEVYTDPLVQQAIQHGDDNQARNLIKEKLCTLGLLSCEGLDAEGKRPLYSNIYAQNGPRPQYPVGRPRPPIGGPPYGQPKPMPPPGKFGPPRKVGYEGPFISKPYIANRPSPIYPGPYVESHDNSLTFSKPPPGAIIYGSKPPNGAVYSGGDAPYNFEHIVGDKIHVEDNHHSSGSFNSFGGSPGFISAGPSAHGSSASFGSSLNSFGGHSKPLLAGAVAAAEGPVASASSQQTHVHHHFHHIEGESANGKQQPNIVAVPVPVPISSHGIASQISTQNTDFTPSIGYASGHQSSSAFNAGFNSASQGNLLSGTLNSIGIKPVTEGFGSFGGSNYEQQSSGGLYNQGSSGVYGGSAAGNYLGANSDYYKKDVNLNSGSQYLNGGSGQQNKYTASNYDYQGFETARQQNVDCACVPAFQCPAADRIGRKDDLILPLDPRNLGTDIEAVENNSTEILNDETQTGTSTKVKREAEADKKESTSEDNTSSEAQARQRQRIRVDNNINNNNNYDDYDNYPAYPQQSSVGVKKRKVLPTFGVSFGLPFPGGNGYPFNAFGGGFPAQNPYFGAIGPNGLSLGPINVNPLVSLQVQKHENGEKIVKPLVNFHVTPSENIIHKVGALFQQKKQEILLNQHVHSHTHLAPPPEIYHPHHTFGNGQIFDPSYQFGQNHQYGFHHTAPPFIGPTGTYGAYNTPHTGFPPPGFGQTGVGPTGYSQTEFGQTGLDYYNSNNFETSSYPGYNFDPYKRSYNITNNLRLGKNLVRFNDDVTGSGYAGNYNYATASHPVNGQDKLGKQINTYNNIDDSHRFGKSNKFGTDLQYNNYHTIPTPAPGHNDGGEHIKFPNDRRRKRSIEDYDFVDLENSEKSEKKLEKRQSYLGQPGGYQPAFQQCRGNEVCCRRPYRQPHQQQLGKCGVRNAHGITGRIKNPVYVDGDSEFGEYPWQAAILKKDPKESVYVCGGTLIDQQHIVTAAHCVKTYQGFDLRVRLGEWDVNHDVEFFPYIESDVVSVTVHPEYYAGTLDNDLAILKLDRPLELAKFQHISPACLPDKFTDFTGARCWTTGWGKDAFGDFGKYQNILKEVDVPVLSHQQCQHQLRQTRLGYQYNLNPGFVCAGGEEGKDACKGDGGGPMVCERNGVWQLVGVVSWGIGCGQVNVPGVYVKVAHYLDWIHQITRY